MHRNTKVSRIHTAEIVDLIVVWMLGVKEPHNLLKKDRHECYISSVIQK